MQICEENGPDHFVIDTVSQHMHLSLHLVHQDPPFIPFLFHLSIQIVIDFVDSQVHAEDSSCMLNGFSVNLNLAYLGVLLG